MNSANRSRKKTPVLSPSQKQSKPRPKPRRPESARPPLYAEAFERLRLVRGWIAAFAALIALAFVFARFLDFVM
jgi:hypothetical protein